MPIFCAVVKSEKEVSRSVGRRACHIPVMPMPAVGRVVLPGVGVVPAGVEKEVGGGAPEPPLGPDGLSIVLVLAIDVVVAEGIIVRQVELGVTPQSYNTAFAAGTV